MQLTATEFRKNLFETLEAALRGETVELTYKGEKLSLVPEKRKYSKLSRMTRRKYFTGPGTSIKDAKQQLLKEMEAEWENDWADL